MNLKTLQYVSSDNKVDRHAYVKCVFVCNQETDWDYKQLENILGGSVCNEMCHCFYHVFYFLTILCELKWHDICANKYSIVLCLLLGTLNNELFKFDAIPFL